MGLDSGILTPRLLGLMALTGRRPAEISLAPSSASPKRNSPFPPLSSMASSKPDRPPGTSFEPYPIPVLADPKKIIRHSLNSGISKASRAPMPSTRPQALSSQSTFLPPSALWTNPGNQATCARPTPPSAANASNLRTRSMTSSWHKSSATNSWGRTHPSLSARVIRILNSKALRHPC